MRRCEDEKVRDRPSLLEEPCAQTLSGTMDFVRHITAGGLQSIPCRFLGDWPCHRWARARWLQLCGIGGHFGPDATTLVATRLEVEPVTCFDREEVPSGKLLHNYGRSPWLMGKSTISMAIFNSYVTIYQRVGDFAEIVFQILKPGEFHEVLPSVFGHQARYRGQFISCHVREVDR